MRVRVNFSGLSSNTTAAHIHCRSAGADPAHESGREDRVLLLKALQVLSVRTAIPQAQLI
jgi:hypothetical protein